jgi:hypothetical protein
MSCSFWSLASFLTDTFVYLPRDGTTEMSITK